MDIQDPKFWKAMCVLLRAVYPDLLLLRMANGNNPPMDQVYFLTYRTITAIEKSIGLLNDEILFGCTAIIDDLSREEDEIFAMHSDSNTDLEAEVNDDESEDENEEEENKDME